MHSENVSVRNADGEEEAPMITDRSCDTQAEETAADTEEPMPSNCDLSELLARCDLSPSGRNDATISGASVSVSVSGTSVNDCTIVALNVEEIYSQSENEDHGGEGLSHSYYESSPTGNKAISCSNNIVHENAPIHAQERIEAIPVEPNESLPEVEPEVDISQNHTYENNQGSDISMLTTSQDQDMGIQKMEYAATPNLSAFASAAFSPCSENSVALDDKDYPFTVTKNTPTCNLPDYKAQINSRSFLNVSFHESNPLVDGTFDERTVSVVAQLADSVHVTLDHSCQISSGNSASTSRNISSRQHNQDDAYIPVVPAVLVPQERLDAEHRHRSDGQESGSTLSTNSSSHMHDHGNNIDVNIITNQNQNRNRTTSRSSKATVDSSVNHSERHFWVRLIIAALLLNSVFVTGVVVASFCAAGKCSSNNQSQIEGADDVSLPSMSYTQAPSTTPSVQPTNSIFDTTTSDINDSLITKVPMTTELATLSPSYFIPSFLPTSIPSTMGNGEGWKDESGPDTSPHTIDSGVVEAGSGRKFGISFVVLEIILALVTETLIIGGLYVYYKIWRRRQRSRQEEKTNSHTPSENTGCDEREHQLIDEFL